MSAIDLEFWRRNPLGYPSHVNINFLFDFSFLTKKSKMKEKKREKLTTLAPACPCITLLQ